MDHDRSIRSEDAHFKFWELLTITILFLVITGWNLHIQSVENPDEPRYAAAVREMLRGGDVLIPVFNGEVRLQKPILYYWLSVGTAWLGTMAGLPLDTALRVEPLLMGLATVLGTCFLALNFLGRRTAIVSACVLMTAYMFHDLSRELVSDMTLAAFVVWFHVLFLKAQNRELSTAKRFTLLTGAYLLAGLACMTKGPVLLFLFILLPIIACSIWSRKVENSISSALWWGIPISLIVGLWWYVTVLMTGQIGDFFFSLDNLQRFTASKGHQRPVPFLYYVVNLSESFAPWWILIPLGVVWTLSRGKEKRWKFSTPHRYALCCTLIPFLILGIAPAKRHLYLLPLYPLLSIWIGWVLREVLRKLETGSLSNNWAHCVFFLFGSVALGLLSTPAWFSGIGGTANEYVLCIWAGVWMTMLTVAGVVQVRSRRFKVAAATALALCLTLPIVLEGTVRPIRERKLALREFYRNVERYAAGRNLIFSGLNANEAVWYLDKNSEKTKEMGLIDMPAFFENSDSRMIIPIQTLLDSSLDTTVIRQSPVLNRYGEDFIIVSPKPGAVVSREQLQSAKESRAKKRKRGPSHGL